MNTIRTINFIFGLFCFVLYSYQFFYLLVPFIKKDKPHKEMKLHRYAVLISARNEEAVIANLVRSIHHQDYPQELIDIYVIADNCTDNTAGAAEAEGAIVFVRNDLTKIGKGFALDYAIERIFREKGEDYYAGFFVFDADNILDTNYISAMNRTFSDGHRIVTSYRNSTNYGANWISAGYALWYIRESQYVNHSRMLLGSGCAITGTGFLVSSEVLKESGGWKYHLLTEDIEFSIAKAIDGERIAFCSDAILYDEQPQTFKQSWKQRLRWARGFLQVFGKYGMKLYSKLFGKNGWTCFDMSVTIFPLNILTVCIGAMNLVTYAIRISTGDAMWYHPFLGLLRWILGIYAMLFAIGFFATITESRRIDTTTQKKILYLFTFPLFQFTYIPISIIAIFRRVRWEPTRHTGPNGKSEDLEQMRERQDRKN